MFHHNVSRYGLATHLALAAALPAALAQFVSTDFLALSMLWVSLAAWIWMLFEPSVLAGETISRARARMLGHILRDPFAWFLLLAILFAFVRWLNSDIRLFYDAEKTVWTVKDPVLTMMPGSSGVSGFIPFVHAIVIATVIMGVRHALGLNARIWFGVMTGAFSAIGGLAAVICVAMGVESFKTEALATYGSASFAGSVFAMILPVSIACGIAAEERGITGARLLFAFAVAGNAAASFVFMPLLMGFSYLVLSAIIAVLGLVLCKHREGAAACARAASMLAFGIVGAVSAVMVPSYKEVVNEKKVGLDVEKAFPPALTDRNEALGRVSMAMWKDHQWGGVGVGAFKLQVPFYANHDDWTVLPSRPDLPSNGYLTILTERGIVGAIFWLVGFGFLLGSWVLRLAGSIKWHRGRDEGRAWFFHMPAMVWVGIAVLIGVFADAYFSSGIVLTSLPVCGAAAMTLAASSFPKMKKRDKEIKD